MKPPAKKSQKAKRKKARNSPARSADRATYERTPLQNVLTPKGNDLSPAGKFGRFQERLKGQFSRLEKEAIDRLAIELNRLMRTIDGAPSPEEVAGQLKEVDLLAGKLAAAISKLHGVSLSVLTRTEELFPPYLLHPRGADSRPPRLSGKDELVQRAFEPELRPLREIEEGEKRARPAQYRTNDPQQLAILEAYRQHQRECAERETSTKYARWRGPPIRDLCVVPFVERLKAFGQLAGIGSREFSGHSARRGQLAALALDSWQVTYAKISWEFIWRECGAAVALCMPSSETGDFVTFIRAIAEYASGQKVEAGFGGAAKLAVKWGRDMVELERLATEHESKNPGIQ
jgi:hypothetical protein